MKKEFKKLNMLNVANSKLLHIYHKIANTAKINSLLG